MKINDVIRTRRQALGLTQEALAERLGVSGPAVNKWEKSLNYPDITLLPTLARVLGVDLNTLLSFQEDMDRGEIGRFCARLQQTAEAEGCAAAVRLAEEKLREFPRNDHLAFSAAGMLEGILTMYPEDGGAERERWRAEIAALYERAAGSEDHQVREWAVFTLAARCVGGGELERAEALLGRLSDTHREKQLLTASLRERQGRAGEAWVLLEQTLFDRAAGILSVLSQMAGLALKEGDRRRARTLADTAAEAGRLLAVPDHAVQSAPLRLALAEEDGPLALSLLEKLLDSLCRPWDLCASPLYPHLPVGGGAAETRRMLLRAVLDGLETDPESRFLWDVPGCRELAAACRERLGI